MNSLEGENLHACADVAYRADTAIAALVMFTSWTAAKPHSHFVTSPMKVGPYVPGEFFRRELPPLLTVIRQLDILPQAIIVDGYVWLNEQEGRKGLGGRLYDAFGGRLPVIGVAKTFFSGSDATAVRRGRSQRPLYVTSIGIATAAAVRVVRSMHGAFRLPTLMRAADRLCRNELARR